jgi:hypothetical protein
MSHEACGVAITFKFRVNLKERELMVDLDIDGRIPFKRILKKWDEKA